MKSYSSPEIQLIYVSIENIIATSSSIPETEAEEGWETLWSPGMK